MLLNVDIAKKLLIKTVSDSYGRKLGRIVGFSIDSKNEIQSIGIELNNGDFSCYSYSQISIENDSVIVNCLWKVEADRLSEQFALILRKNSALNKLYNSGEISQEVYDEIRKQYEATIDLAERCQVLSEDLRGRIKALNIQIGELKTFLANIKIEYQLENIDEETYKFSCETLQTILNRILLEKRDVDIALNNLPKNPTISQTISLDTSRITNQPQPIVLRIKEAEP